MTDPEHRVSFDANSVEAVAEAILRLSAAVHRYRTMVAKDRYGVDTAGGIAIIALATQGAMTPSEIAALVNLTPPATTELLDRLGRVGYIERRRHPVDRRKLLISPTPLALADVHRETVGLAEVLGPALPDGPATNGLLDTLTEITHGVERANTDIAGRSG